MIRHALAVVILLPLCGCGAALLPVLAGLASGSTLLKNEANCSLTDLGACSMPHITLPAVIVAPSPVTTRMTILTMDPVPNP